MAAAGTRAAICRRGAESPEALRGVRLQDAEAPEDHAGPGSQIVRAASLGDGAGDLGRAVIDLERNPLSLTDCGNRGRAHFHEREPARLLGAGIGIRDTEEIAEIRLVVRA